MAILSLLEVQDRIVDRCQSVHDLATEELIRDAQRGDAINCVVIVGRGKLCSNYGRT